MYIIYLLFLHRKLQQIVRICCWQYHFRNSLPDKPMTILENIFKYKLFIWLLFKSKLQQKWEYVVDNIIFGPSYPIKLWESFRTHFYVYYLFYFFLFVNNNKKSYYVFDNNIFRIVLHDYVLIIFETTFRCKLYI